MNSTLVAKHIVNWLREDASSDGVEGVVIGISGGIDSAVNSVLGAQTGLDLI